MSKSSSLSTRKLVMMGILIAMYIVFDKFLSFHTQFLRIGFSFVPLVFAAILYGPLAAGVVGAVGDLLGTLAFNFDPGAFFPGFTVSAFLIGLIFGVFLHRDQKFFHVILAALAVQFGVGLLLNTFWLSILYQSAYLPLLATRVFQSAGMSVVQIVVIPILAQLVNRVGAAYIEKKESA